MEVSLVPFPGQIAAGVQARLGLRRALPSRSGFVVEPFGVQHYLDVFRAMKESGSQIGPVFPDFVDNIDSLGFPKVHRFFEAIRNEPFPNKQFVFYHEGKFHGLGAIRPSIDEGAVQLLIWVKEASEGQGIATQMVKILTYGALEVEGITSVQLQHQSSNRRIRHIAEKLGFELRQALDKENGKPSEEPNWLVWGKFSP